MTRLSVSPGFWLLLAAVWALEPELLLPTALAALCHELGHCAALGLAGGRVASLRLSALGAELRPAGMLSYGRELPVVLAGPAVSLLCALAAARLGRYVFAGLSLALGLFNLLPIPPLDGGRAAACLCALTLPTPWDRVVPRWVAVGAAGCLMGAAWAAFLRFRALSLLLLAGWLAVQSLRA